jgi:hypothetical protein
MLYDRRRWSGRVRVEAAEDITAARAVAKRGAYQEAVEILENRQRAVAQSGDGDTVIMALSAELQEMPGRVSSQQNYAQSGRAYMLAGMSAHAQQRANSRQMMQAQVPVFGAAVQDEATLAYATPAVRAMLLRSRRASAEQGHCNSVLGSNNNSCNSFSSCNVNNNVNISNWSISSCSCSIPKLEKTHIALNRRSRRRNQLPCFGK